MKSYYVELYQKGKARIIQEEISDADLQDNEAIILTDFSMISAGTELSRVFEIKKDFRIRSDPATVQWEQYLKRSGNQGF